MQNDHRLTRDFGKNPLRVLFVSQADWAFQTHRIFLARWLKQRGAVVGILCPQVGKATAELEAEGFELFSMELSRERISPIRIFSSVTSVKEVCERFQADVLHCVSIRCVLLGWLAMRNVKPPPRIINHVVGMGSIYANKNRSIQSWMMKRLVDFGLRRAFHSSRAQTVFQNPDDLNLWMDRAGLADNKTELIPGSISWVDQERTPEPSVKPLKILFVGRMLRNKGVEDLYRAWRSLRGEGIKVELIFCGDIDKGSPSSLTREEMCAYGAEAGCTWIGHRDDVMDIIKKCNLVILPSYREGFPKVILEAGLCARAVIATDVPGCRELVVHEKSGIIVQKGDIRGLALAIQGLLKDEAKRKTLAGALHRHVQSHYTDDIVNPFWWELYTRKT